jgi:iron complex transport system substrate-binding protein
MKTKNKMLASLEIAIVLCSVLLVAIPVIAAEQNQEMQNANANTITTASEDDYVLGIYGNANEDDTIDMRDLTYVKLIFFGKKPETELADAKYDGKINPLDFIQIKLIIVGKEKELTVVDSADRIVTVKKPVERVIVLGDSQADAMRVLRAEKKAVGRDSSPPEYILVPVISELPTVGDYLKPDAEAILALEPDIVLGYSLLKADLDEKIKPYVAVVRLNFRGKTMVEDMKKLGYILDKPNEAEEFCDWHEGYIDMIKDRTKGLSEEDKPRVFLENYPHYKKYYTGGKKCAEGYICEMAGGINIAADKPSGVVDPEWVVVQNPDFIMVGAMSRDPSGYGVDDITGVKATREEVMNRPELKKTNAVKNGNVYCTASDIVHGIQSFISITYWTKWFHPTLFEDLDPHAIQKEYLTRFQRIDYDIDKHGVFVYHPEEHPDGH